MAQDIIISISLYFLLLICQNSNAFSLPESLEKNSDLTEFPNRQQLQKKIKREIDSFLARENKSTRNIKNVSENLHKYTYPRSASAYNYLLFKSWGARGMPFNVLYTSNIHQQKIKSIPKKTEKGKTTKVTKPMPDIYDFILEDGKPKNLENTWKKNVKPRKYYSLIPQLFVSYGW